MFIHRLSLLIFVFLFPLVLSCAVAFADDSEISIWQGSIKGNEVESLEIHFLDFQTPTPTPLPQSNEDFVRFNWEGSQLAPISPTPIFTPIPETAGSLLEEELTSPDAGIVTIPLEELGTTGAQIIGPSGQVSVKQVSESNPTPVESRSPSPTPSRLFESKSASTITAKPTSKNDQEISPDEHSQYDVTSLKKLKRKLFVEMIIESKIACDTKHAPDNIAVRACFRQAVKKGLMDQIQRLRGFQLECRSRVEKEQVHSCALEKYLRTHQ